MEKNHCSTGIHLDDPGMVADNQSSWTGLKDYLSVLKDISHRLRDAAVHGELEVMADLVSQRQLIINLGAKLTLLEASPVTPPAQIAADFRELLMSEQNLIHQLTTRQAIVLERLKSLDQGKRLLNTYNRGGATQPRFLDMRQ